MRIEPVSRMEKRLEMLEAPERYGITVDETCRLYQVSRETFYYWRRRFEAEGAAGLENRSTAPHRSPGRIPEELENQIVDFRKKNRRWGPRRISDELERAGIVGPARSTIGRVLKRNHLIGKATSPKPVPPVRFVREQANELWQIDAKEWKLEEGTKVHIVSCLDDCSRVCGGIEAFFDLSGGAGIAVFDSAADSNGLPESVLTDRGANFTGRTTQTVSDFERHLWALDVYTINGRPYHPQTQGKVERFHRTLGEWLVDHGPFPTLKTLNTSLTGFAHHYNHQRPHQSLDGKTPAEVWDTVEKAKPDPDLAEQRCRRTTIRPTGSTGNITYAKWVIGLGRAWANTKVRVIDTGSLIQIWAPDGTLIRQLEPDPTRRYLGTHNPTPKAQQ